MAEEEKMNIDELQKQIAGEVMELIRTKVNTEISKDILCALITINKVTGQLLINTANSPLMADTKMMLQEGLDMLNRSQIMTALMGRIIAQKGVKNDSPIIQR